MAGSLHFVLGLAALGGELTTEVASWVWQHTSKAGRLDRHLKRLEQAGVLTASGPVDQRMLRLTDEGRRQASGGVDPVAQWNRRWDGAWRIVAFDIPEARAGLRKKLRRRLHELRFGYLQNSVWISPDPVEEFRAGLGESGIAPDSLTYFKAFPDGGESSEALVASAWDFGDLAKRYTDYRALLRLRPSRVAGTPAAWVHWLELEHRAWSHIAHRDPFLPAALLPRDYDGRTVWAERRAALGEFVRVVPAG
jgi:phenylacetic acid degradation operon negative regulatory protein